MPKLVRDGVHRFVRGTDAYSLEEGGGYRPEGRTARDLIPLLLTLICQEYNSSGLLSFDYPMQCGLWAGDPL